MKNLANFEKAFEKTLGFEGGYSLNLHNQITTYAGISRLISPYWAGWKYTDKGEKPPDEEVKDYFFLDLWCPIWCRFIDDDDIAWALFDHAVVSGKEAAIKDLQEILGVKATGNMGCTTVEMINCIDELDTQLKYAIARIRRYLKEENTYDLLISKVNRAIAGINV